MSEMLNKIIERRSVKKYRPDPVPKEILDNIIRAGTFAPSGMNRQSSVIIAITDKETRDMLANLNAQIMGREGIDPFYGAPVVLVVLANKTVSTYLHDGSLVMGNLMLAAHAEGLGSCWVHRAKQEFETEQGKALLKKLGISENYEGIGNCIIGYTDGEYPVPRERKENYVYYLK